MNWRRGRIFRREACCSRCRGSRAPVAAAIQAAIHEIDRRLQLWGLLENVYYGISLGAVLLLAAAGLAITFGVMGVINMAHGEMVMIGAYTTFVVQQLIAASTPALTDLGLLFAVPAAFLVAGTLGVVIERTLIRFLYGRPLETLLATWGLSLILQQAVRSIFGPTNQDVSSPPWMSGALSLGGLTLTVNRLWIIVFAALVLGALMGVLRWGGLGRSIRAVMQNRRMAAVMGIRTPLDRRADLRSRLRHRRHRRGGAEPDRQCQPQSRAKLHHRQLHGGGARRRRQFVGHGARGHELRGGR